ncbi:MAG TPA: ABC transporter substrate-binding protein [Pseudothermotoga sp.]|nr:ABC transporter substrate-binding protein [Pseudothermotoga sp.]HOK83487.1 ABC transporter substrate-binding protein [Pseudothermotoga sp.]HPP69560.1 ABC transporter substrate-binding protein [Pseudothermotoga sp.]
MKKLLVGLVLLSFVVFAFAKVNFGSTQMTPAAEREFMIRLLGDFSKSSGVEIEFLNFEYTDLLSRVEAEQKAGKVVLNLIADLQSGLYTMGSSGLLTDLSSVNFQGKTFVSTFERYTYAGKEKVFFPWLQATYAMAINKKAFDYLPKGLTQQDVMNATEKWTYDSLLEWAKNMQEKTKQPQLGFPLGPKGLWHRFLHGYIYPSYTGAQATKFDSVKAIDMWNYLRELFKYVHPACTTWDNMDQPLLRGEVMIAWDHTARIKQAIVERPNDFVVVPVPRGPMGRGYIIVLVGLSIPKNANMDEPLKVIDFLTSPKAQNAILENLGFFPVVQEAAGQIPEGGLKILAQGVVSQSSAPDSIVCFIPGLGAKGGEFSETYRMAFTRIVFNKEDPVKVIGELGEKIRQIFKEVGAPLPEPDSSLF